LAEKAIIQDALILANGACSLSGVTFYNNDRRRLYDDRNRLLNHAAHTCHHPGHDDGAKA